MKLSVIIPAYNEERTIASMLEDLLTRHEPDEVIVVDGGSMDETQKRARNFIRPRLKVMTSPKGRARQMNVGAREASGDLFLFLHADTRLPESGLSKIKEAIWNGAQAGRFQLQFDDPRWILKCYASYTRFHLFSYGDQGFFLRRELFERLGGFREDVPFEDIDFYKRLRRVTKPIILKERVTTSARRFVKVGFFRQKLINLLLVGLHSLGANVEGLKRALYPEVRSRAGTFEWCGRDGALKSEGPPPSFSCSSENSQAS